MPRVNEIDIFDIEIFCDVSPKDVFREQSATVTSLIADPARFGDELVAAKIIAPHVVDGVKSQLGVTSYDKASRLVSEVARILAVSKDLNLNPYEKLIDFCRVLKKQESQELDEIVKKILHKIGVCVSLCTCTCC